jgi:hypothetical protein
MQFNFLHFYFSFNVSSPLPWCIFPKKLYITFPVPNLFYGKLHKTFPANLNPNTKPPPSHDHHLDRFATVGPAHVKSRDLRRSNLSLRRHRFHFSQPHQSYTSELIHVAAKRNRIGTSSLSSLFFLLYSCWLELK